MKNKIQALLKRIDLLAAQNISHDDALGLQNGFHEIEQIKNELASVYRDILNGLLSVIDILPEHFTETKVNLIETQVAALEGLAKRVGETSKLKATDPRFFQARTQAHTSAREQKSVNIGTLDDVRLAILTGQTSAAIGQADIIRHQAAATQILSELNKAKEKADKALAALQDQAAKKTYQVSQTGYTILSGNHKKREWWWFFSVCAAMLLLSAAVAYVIWGDYSADSMEAAILLVTRKVFMISIPLLILRISLTKYNVERFLRIVYDHRSAAVSQLQLLEAAIDDDKAAKAGLRLEAAKMILSDPIACYGQPSDSSEINISPVFSTLEKLSGKG